MPQLALNKTSLTRESRQLGTYEKFLPSLDLKRRQLIAERNKARRALDGARARIEAIEQASGRELPMAADARLSLSGIVAVKRVRLAHENLVGLRLPLLADVEIDHADYSFLTRPHWVDSLVDTLERLLRLRVEAQVLERRLAILTTAVNKITQRVNLFDKVLIPRTRENIRRIRIKLADAEKAGVVNAKISKRKRRLR